MVYKKVSYKQEKKVFFTESKILVQALQETVLQIRRADRHVLIND